MFRALLAALLIAPLLIALPPVGALTDAAGHGYGYQAVFAIEQGGEVMLNVTLWNNGTTDDLASFDSRCCAGPVATGPSPSPISVPAGSFVVAQLKVATFAGDPGDYVVPATVQWSHGSDWSSPTRQDFSIPVRVVPAYWGLSVTTPAQRYPFDSDGKSVDIPIVVRNDGDEPIDYVTSFKLYGETALVNHTASTSLAPHANQTRTLTLDWGRSGWWPPRQGQYPVNISLQYSGHPVTREYPFTYITLDVAPAGQPQEGVAMSMTPPTASVEQGGDTPFILSLDEAAGASTDYHLDINVTDKDPEAPRAIFDNMLVHLGPHEHREVNVTMRTTTSTLPGTYTIVASLTSQATGNVVNATRADLLVKDPPPQNITLDIQPRAGESAPGGNVSYAVDVTERSGRAATVRLTSSVTAGRADDLFVGVTSGDIHLDPEATARVGLFVRAAANATPGERRIAVSVYRIGAVFDTQEVSFTVREPAPVQASIHVEANLERDDLVADASAAADIRVRLWQNGTGAARVRVLVNASADVFETPFPEGSADLAAGAKTTLSLPLKLGPAAGVAGRHHVLLYVFAEGSDGPWTILHANVSVFPDVPLLVNVDPAAAAPNETANVTFHLTDAGLRPLLVTIDPPVDAAVNSSRFDLVPGATADVLATFEVPADAEPGSIVVRTLVLRSDGHERTVNVTVTVSPISVPPAPQLPESDLGSPLKTAGDLIAAHPAAAVSLSVAAAAVVALPLARREPWRFVAMAAALPLYTRLAKPQLLADARRGEIHAIVTARPGISLTELGRAAGIGTGALVHHLRMLERHGFLTSRRDGKLRRFYVVGAAPSAVVASPTAMQDQILGLLAAGPMTRPEIGARLGLSQQGVSYHVKNLERAGRVVVRREAGEARVHRVYDVVVVTPRPKP